MKTRACYAARLYFLKESRLEMSSADSSRTAYDINADCDVRHSLRSSSRNEEAVRFFSENEESFLFIISLDALSVFFLLPDILC